MILVFESRLYDVKEKVDRDWKMQANFKTMAISWLFVTEIGVLSARFMTKGHIVKGKENQWARSLGP